MTKLLAETIPCNRMCGKQKQLVTEGPKGCHFSTKPEMEMHQTVRKELQTLIKRLSSHIFLE